MPYLINVLPLMQVGPQQLCNHVVLLQPCIDTLHDLALVRPAEVLSSSQDAEGLTNSAEVLVEVAVAQHLQNESALHTPDLQAHWKVLFVCNKV